MAKVAINGFGRIGRNALRAYLKSQPKGFEIVAINDPLQDLDQSAHLLKYDSVLGELPFEVSHTEDALVIDGKKITFSREKDPSTCHGASSASTSFLSAAASSLKPRKQKGTSRLVPRKFSSLLPLKMKTSQSFSASTIRTTIQRSTTSFQRQLHNQLLGSSG